MNQLQELTSKNPRSTTVVEDRSTTIVGSITGSGVKGEGCVSVDEQIGVVLDPETSAFHGGKVISDS